MIKRVIIVHGWEGSAGSDWFPWLKEELSKRGFKVVLRSIPDTDAPSIKTWVPFLTQLAKKADSNTYFVGHSVGCQTILRFLEKLDKSAKVGGAVFVAPWLTLKGLKTKEEKEIAREWLETKIDFVKVRKICHKFTAIFSDDDYYVPLENRRFFSEKLGAKTVTIKKKGHISGADGVRKLPVALKEFLEITKI